MLAKKFPKFEFLGSVSFNLKILFFFITLSFLAAYFILVYSLLTIYSSKNPNLDSKNEPVKIPTTSGTQVITSDIHGYTIAYDSGIWNLFTQSDNKDHGVLRFNTGSLESFVSVKFDAMKSDYFYSNGKEKESKLIKCVNDPLYSANCYYNVVWVKGREILKEEKVTINGVDFIKTTSSFTPSADKSITSYETTYVGIKNDGVYVLTISYTNTYSENYSEADALIANFKLFDPNNPAQDVMGTSDSRDLFVEGDDAKTVALVKPSVVRILNKYCGTLSFEISPTLYEVSGKSYDYCVAGLGSGFFINHNGYIATNGHVVKFFDDESVAYAITRGDLDNYLVDYLFADAKSQGKQASQLEVQSKLAGIKADPALLELYATATLQLYDQGLAKINNVSQELFVQLGRDPFKVGLNYSVGTSSNIVSAKLVAYDYENLMDFKNGFTASDVAIIKIIGSDYPAISLGSGDNLKNASQIFVIGFPGLADNPSLVDASAQVEPTITKGIVSAIKKSSGNKKTLIQTDASISHGNSGGPAIDLEGNVVGIATYGLSPEGTGGNYNFLRDIKDLKDLMEDNKITNETGATYKAWKSGIDSFWAEDYPSSITSFREVSKLYPRHPDSEEYIKEAQNKIIEGKGKPQTINYSIYVLFGVSLAAALVSSLLTLLLIRKLNTQKKVTQLHQI